MPDSATTGLPPTITATADEARAKAAGLVRDAEEVASRLGVSTPPERVPIPTSPAPGLVVHVTPVSSVKSGDSVMTHHAYLHDALDRAGDVLRSILARL